MNDHEIQAAALELAEKYASLPLEGLNLSPFTRRYVEDYRSNGDVLAANWLRSAHIIHTALAHAGSEPATTCLIDCGGGQGLLSLLAVRLGFHTVVYSDLGVQMTADARAIAGRFGLPATHYVAGDLSVVAQTLDDDASPHRVVVSSNVIEHVYNLDELWDACASLGRNRHFTAVWCSDANSANPFRARNRRQIHRFIEHQDRAPSDWESELDSRSSFYSLRRKMIADLLPEESPRTIDTLAEATRGKHRADIAVAVEKFRRTRRIDHPVHPTNTCNPETGNWCERLIDLRATEDDLRARGWQVEVEPGFYGPRSGLAAGLVVKTLNGLIAALHPASLVISPVYLLTLHKTAAMPISQSPPA